MLAVAMKNKEFVIRTSKDDLGVALAIRKVLVENGCSNLKGSGVVRYG